MRNLLPDPDPNASSELAPTDESIAMANVASGAEVVSQFEQSVKNLTAGKSVV